MKESAEASERNAESIREAAQANEELRQKGDARTVKRRERRKRNGTEDRAQNKAAREPKKNVQQSRIRIKVPAFSVSSVLSVIIRSSSRSMKDSGADRETRIRRNRSGDCPACRLSGGIFFGI